MRTKLKFQSGAQFSPWQLLDMANAYYVLSCALTDKLPANTHPSANMPKSGEIAASATNRILALELYLKALLAGHNTDMPLTHDLVLLYKSLPQESQDEVQNKFEQLNHIEKAGENLAELIICFQLSKQLPADWTSKAYKYSPKDTSLAAVLERNRSGFVFSRYLFEQAKFDRETLYWYEFWRLALICSIVCEILEDNLQNRSPSYKRSFQF